jgi:very-short-patch-repair endonuclease
MTRHDIDEAVAALATSQAGAFSRRQALEVGATPKIVRARVRSGAWRADADGVYVVRGAPTTWHTRLFVAVLATSAGAVVSHGAAAVLHGMATFSGRPVVVTVPHAAARVERVSGVHQSRRLYPDHVTSIDGLPVTTAARTLVDLAATERRGRIEIALDRALSSRALTMDTFCATIDDLSGGRRRGLKAIKDLASARCGGSYIAPASVAESLLARALRLGGLPRPVLQFRHPGRGFEGRRVDAAYPNARILIEVDSRTWHGGWIDMERDRERDLAAAAVGYHTLRIAYRHLEERPDWVADQVREALAATAAA